MQPPPGPTSPAPDTPMTDDGQHQPSAKKVRTYKRSFADTVASQATFTFDEDQTSDEYDWAFEEPDIESDSELEMHDESDGRPRVHISKALRQELCQEWSLALIIKYLGKNISFHVLQHRLPGLWGLQGRLHLIDIGYGCFVARFDNKKDYLHVLLDGPWKMFDNYLVAQRWVPEYKPKTAKLAKMAVWVRLPDLHIEYFRDDIIKSILSNIGKPLKLDRTTIARERGRFARAAVEVDLDKPLVSEILIRNSVQQVEYEGLHVVCFGCGIVGHREQDCPHAQTKPAETACPVDNTSPEAATEGNQQQQTTAPTPVTATLKPRYGTWMLVTRKPKLTNQTNQKKNQQQHKQSVSSSGKNGNRFQSLAGMVEQIVNPRISNSKGKQPAEPRSGNTRKFPPSSNSTRSSTPYVPATAATTVPSARPIPSQNGQGRGGNQSARRGKGRGSSRGGLLSAGESSATGVWRGAFNDTGVFQFGGQSASYRNLTTAAVPPTEAMPSFCPTPGEGGNQTSLPADVSP